MINDNEKKNMFRYYVTQRPIDIGTIPNAKSAVNITRYEERKKLVEAVRYVDLVLPEENWEQKLSDIKEYKVDTFVMGDDWKEKFDFLKKYCHLLYAQNQFHLLIFP